MNIWIFQTGEPLHTDQGIHRGMRAMNLADALVTSGHKVIIWSSDFFHQQKKHRTGVFSTIKVNDSIEIRLIPSPGYFKNIGLMRLLDHAILAINLRKCLASEASCPDVAFVGYPPIEFSYVAINWLRLRQVPVMLDAKDMWPEIFLRPFHKLVRPLVKLIFFPYFFMAQSLMRNADVLCSITPAFLDWMCTFSRRSLSRKDVVASLSPILQASRDVEAAVKWWRGHGVCDDGRKRFFFVGSFTQTFDFNPIMHAAYHAGKSGLDWQFVLSGDGPCLPQIKYLLKDLHNVVIPGWVDRDKIIALAALSTAGLAPYRNFDDFTMSIPNKIIDYLALGKPIVSPLRGEVEALIHSRKVGVMYSDLNEDSLFSSLNELCGNDVYISRLAHNALETYDLKFNGEKVYAELASHVEALSKIHAR